MLPSNTKGIDKDGTVYLGSRRIEFYIDGGYGFIRQYYSGIQEMEWGGTDTTRVNPTLGGTLERAGTPYVQWGNGTLGFFNTTPATRPAAIADASGGATIDAEARTALNALLAGMRSLGLIAT